MTIGGRRRGKETTDAILEAAIDVLVERGFADMTMEAVAERAGSSKATLYRRWDNKVALLTEAVAATIEPSEVEDLGSVSAELLAHYRERLELYASDRGRRLVAALIGAAPTDEGLSLALRAWLANTADEVRSMLLRGQARGEVRSDIGIDNLVTMVAAPLLYRAVVEQVAPDSDLLEDYIAMAVRAMAPPEQP